MKIYEPKPKFIERMGLLLDGEQDLKNFLETSKTQSRKSIRVNTLKMNPDELKNRLEKKNWKIKQPFKNYQEIFIIDNELEPGELGKTKEHLLGYYYVQEITSMMPIISLQPKVGDSLLDLCASPGSKTTQAAAVMENKGTIIANDLTVNRLSILSSNLERCGVMNTIVTRHDGFELCSKLKKLPIVFNKILIDAPCSGEGNIRTSNRTFLEWSEPLLKSLSRKQKRLVSLAPFLLKKNGEIVYSTCTYAPEENEFIVQYLIDNFDLEILDINLPIKTRPGILEWYDNKFHHSMKKAVRIYHHDNDLEGFFLCKMRKRN